MAVPSGYTETTLAAFMEDCLGETATVLSLSAANGDFAEAVNQAVGVYGVDDVTTISGRENILSLRAVARAIAWSRAQAACAMDYNFSADGGRFDRSQMHEQASKMLAEARAEAMQFGHWNEVGVDRIQFKHDPYTYVPDDERGYEVG